MLVSFARKALLASMGAVVLTEEKINQLIESLVKKGSLSQEQAQKVVDELLEKGEEAQKELEKVLYQVVQLALEKMDLPTASDLQKLSDRIGQLEKSLQKRPKQKEK